VREESTEQQFNIHLDPEHLAGSYSNFANISFSKYEFTITFARVDHEANESEIPGVVVSRINVSPRFMKELLEAMEDCVFKWENQEEIHNPPNQSSENAN
tara:strand:+ start:113 stop:412 length:300 start_codon:yes stop_codon:yes gene_type:complete